MCLLSFAIFFSVHVLVRNVVYLKLAKISGTKDPVFTKYGNDALITTFEITGLDVQWWMVDLIEIHQISFVVLRYRLETSEERALGIVSQNLIYKRYIKLLYITL